MANFKMDVTRKQITLSFPKNKHFLFPNMHTGISPASNYMFKVNNRNTRTRCEMCSKLTVKISERRQCRRPMVSLLLTLNIFLTLFQCFYSNFEQQKCRLRGSKKFLFPPFGDPFFCLITDDLVFLFFPRFSVSKYS